MLLGAAGDDDAAMAERFTGGIARLWIIENDEGKFDPSVLDTGGSVLVVSNLTLLGDTSKGNRPSFTEAAPPDEAERLYEIFCSDLLALGVDVERGSFGAQMRVELANDGPVTIVLNA